MSATLMWEPKKRKAKSLPDALKFILRDKHGLDGRETWGTATIPYLRGLVDGGVDGAQELIAAIEAHAEVELWLEY